MQEHRHSGARALPENPECRNTDQKNQWLGLCSWIPGPALTVRPGMTREFFSTLLESEEKLRSSLSLLEGNCRGLSCRRWHWDEATSAPQSEPGRAERRRIDKGQVTGDNVCRQLAGFVDLPIADSRVSAAANEGSYR
jgi:hypothetical protein